MHRRFAKLFSSSSGLAFIVIFASCGACAELRGPHGSGPCVVQQTPADVPWLTPDNLAREIDLIDATVPGAREADAPPSATFVSAQRDYKVEFWLDAAKGFWAVARGDTQDNRPVRQLAQFHFAVSLYRLKYFDEAGVLFAAIEANKDHPRRESAYQWRRKKYCAGD